LNAATNPSATSTQATTISAIFWARLTPRNTTATGPVLPVLPSASPTDQEEARG
jgi:hypothetical protein